MEVFAQVEFGEGLLADFRSKFAVLAQVFGGDQSITVDALGLVDPQFNQKIGFLDRFNLCNEQSLENVGQVTHVEFVMEVDGSLTESLRDVRMELQGALDDRSNQFLDGALELAEMLVEEGAVDRVQGRRVGELNS